MKPAAMTLALLTLAGCAQPYVMKTRFDPAEVAWSKSPGTASIMGEGFMRTRGGEVRTCAGLNAVLVPKSTYTTEGHAMFQRTLGAGIGAGDPAALAFARTTKCDAQGRFEFRDLPAGDWYVRVVVVWEVTGALQPQQGGVLSEPVHTDNGKATEVIASR